MRLRPLVFGTEGAGGGWAPGRWLVCGQGQRAGSRDEAPTPACPARSVPDGPEMCPEGLWVREGRGGGWGRAGRGRGGEEGVAVMNGHRVPAASFTWGVQFKARDFSLETRAGCTSLRSSIPAPPSWPYPFVVVASTPPPAPLMLWGAQPLMGSVTCKWFLTSVDLRAT